MAGKRRSRPLDAWGIETYQTIVRTGEQVVERAGLYALKQAKSYAPVRRVFVGQRRRKQAVPPEKMAARYAVAAMRRGARGNNIPTVSPEQAEYLSQKSMHPRRMRAAAPPDVSRKRLTVTGHVNSFNPIFREGHSRVTGDFRRIDPLDPGRLATVSATKSRSSAPSVGLAVTRNAQARLSVRGRYELATGRANYTDAEGVTRLGGRLRGEIYVQNYREFEGKLTAEVISPTPYAAPQEFGTSHNRSHPFLRPALYDTRERFRTWARLAFHEMTKRGRG